MESLTRLSLPKVSRSVLALVWVLSLASLVRSNFAEVFSISLKSPEWWMLQVFSAGFFERSIYFLLINSFLFWLAGKYLELAWGPNEFLKFVFIINVLTYAASAAALFINYMLTRNTILVTSATANGLIGLLAGFLVAFKQMVPEHTIKIFKIISIRVKHIPSIFVLIYFILFVVQLISVQFYIVFFGTLTSWIYIRFFKLQDGIRGDKSEAFSIASFFPEVTHSYIKPVSNSVYNVFVALSLCPQISEPVLPVSSTESKIYTVDTADAERRRALALRALDMRLQQQQQQRGQSQPVSQEAEGQQIQNNLELVATESGVVEPIPAMDTSVEVEVKESKD